jgi:hypothetical protein
MEWSVAGLTEHNESPILFDDDVSNAKKRIAFPVRVSSPVSTIRAFQ